MRFLYLILLCGLAFGPVFQTNFAQAAARPDKNPVEIYRNMTELSSLASDLHIALLNADRALLRHLLERDMRHLNEVQYHLGLARELTSRADATALFDQQRHQFRQLGRDVEQLGLPANGGLHYSRDAYKSGLVPMNEYLDDLSQTLSESARQGENTDLLHEVAGVQRLLSALAVAQARYVEGADESQAGRVMDYLDQLRQSLEKMRDLAKTETERIVLAEVTRLVGEEYKLFHGLRESIQTFTAEVSNFSRQLEDSLRHAKRLNEELDGMARDAGIELLIQDYARPLFDGRI